MALGFSLRLCLLLCSIINTCVEQALKLQLLSSMLPALMHAVPKSHAEGQCAAMQGPIQNLNEHLASPFVNNGFANATKCVPPPPACLT